MSESILEFGEPVPFYLGGDCRVFNRKYRGTEGKIEIAANEKMLDWKIHADLPIPLLVTELLADGRTMREFCFDPSGANLLPTHDADIRTLVFTAVTRPQPLEIAVTVERSQ